MSSFGDSNESSDLGHPRFEIAQQMGEDAARGLSSPWAEAELMLQGIWRQDAFGMTWAEARDAVYEGWLRGKRELGVVE